MAGGRPTKLTPGLQASIVQGLERGNFVETVCDLVGVHKDTFYEWMRRGERASKRDVEAGYVQFSDAIKKATAQIESDTVEDVKTGVFNWQSRAWWLERRHPDKWGNRGKQVQTNVNVNIDVSQLSIEDLERIARGEDVDLAAIASKSRA